MYDEKAYMREYRKKNADKIREKKRALYWKNIDASRAANSRNYHKHAESRKAKVKLYVSENREAHSGYCKKWSANNRDKVRSYVINRRSKIAASGGMISGEEIRVIVQRQNGKCAVCGDPAKLTMDHIMPLALGGGGSFRNFQGLCKSCNSSKCDKHPIDFNRSRGLLL